jgi:hypothetical protein
VLVLCLGWRGGVVVTFGGGGSCGWLVSKAGKATLKLGELIICFKELFQKESGDSMFIAFL